MSHDSIIDKLKKLMTKEEGCRKIGNLEEAGLYAAKIAEWCLRYKIELAAISTEMERENDKKNISQEFINPSGAAGHKTIWWQNTLARMICEYTGCVHVLVHRSNEMILIGKDVDRQTARYLLTTLVQFVAKESQRQYDREYYVVCEKGGAPSYYLKDYKVSWIKGAVETFRERLEEMKKRFQEECVANVGVALILRSDCEASKQWMNDNLTNLKDTKVSSPGSIHNARGFAAGKKAAEGVSLNRPLSDTSKHKVIA